MQDKVIVDFDNDGDYDLITNSMPHDVDADGDFSFIQVVENNVGNFNDITSEVYVNNLHTNRYIGLLKAYDIDEDGFINIFETETHKEDWFNVEWDGNKFSEQLDN
jgi:hypothetical protein